MNWTSGPTWKRSEMGSPDQASTVSLAYRDDDREDPVNPDFTRPVRVRSADLAWQATPEPGVVRKRLELVGEGKPRLTTLVRFAPGSRFAEHGHDGGEEFLVLDGTFSDHTGDFHAGSYVRNPVGFRHAPYTDPGCMLFVKLRQHRTGDRQRVITDTAAARWPGADLQGHALLDLHRYGGERVRLCRLERGANPLDLTDPGGMEVLVIAGQIEDAEGTWEPGSWLRLPPAFEWWVRSPSGGCFYLKTGHLESMKIRGRFSRSRR